LSVALGPAFLSVIAGGVADLGESVHEAFGAARRAGKAHEVSPAPISNAPAVVVRRLVKMRGLARPS